MARNQFSYQKRQKELAKKKKREEKLARRQESKQANADIPIEDQLPTVNQFGEVIETPAERIQVETVDPDDQPPSD